MESSTPARVLVVAHKTAATQPLLDAVRERAAAGPANFTLLVPRGAHGMHKVVDPEDSGGDEAEKVVAQAVPLLSEAAGTPVEGIIGDADPVAAVQDALNMRGFDEVIVSTLSARISRASCTETFSVIITIFSSCGLTRTSSATPSRTLDGGR